MKTLRSKDGTNIAYDKKGHGPALILIDGALCYRASGPMEPLAALLTDHFTVYTYDRRGRGESGDTLPYAVQREVEDIEALLQEAGGEAYVYGISSGAALALEAASHLSGIKKLALYEAPFIVDNSHPARPDDLIERTDRLIAQNKRSDAVKLFMKTVDAPMIMINLMRFTPAWGKLTAVAHTIPYDFRILGDTGSGKALSKDRWAAATMPTLVMDGGKSPRYMRNSQKAIADVLSNADYRTLPGQTHMLSAEAVAPVLKEFFTENVKTVETPVRETIR
jgi:pimeloyl-ACP methyl ester carboxylesterase